MAAGVAVVSGTTVLRSRSASSFCCFSFCAVVMVMGYYLFSRGLIFTVELRGGLDRIVILDTRLPFFCATAAQLDRAKVSRVPINVDIARGLGEERENC